MKRPSFFSRSAMAVMFVWFSIFSILTPLLADTFEIRGMGTITGKLLSEPGSSMLKIMTNDGVELEIASGKIKSQVITPVEKEKAYLASFFGKEDSVELHRALSKDCLDIKALAYAHRERVVELDPSHENWTALGDMTIDEKSGEYIKREVAFKRKGMVKESGRWDTPQSYAIVKLEKSQKEEEALIRQSIKTNLLNLNNERAPKQARAKSIEFFSTLQNPKAISVIYEDYFKDNPNHKQAEVFMPILARMPGNTASYVFVHLAMNSNNNEVVKVALELLSRDQSKEFAMNAFLNVIRNPKSPPDKVDKAGTHIQSFLDKVAIPDLIERLVTIQKRTISIPGENTFNKDGSGGAGGISTPRTVKQETVHNHQSVLAALVELADGANYHFDIPQWRIWYANTYSKSNLDLRRDE